MKWATEIARLSPAEVLLPLPRGEGGGEGFTALQIPQSLPRPSQEEEGSIRTEFTRTLTHFLNIPFTLFTRDLIFEGFSSFVGSGFLIGLGVGDGEGVGVAVGDGTLATLAFAD